MNPPTAPATAPLQPTAAHGPSLSRIVAGAWRMAEWGWSPEERLRWIEACAELGVTSFDHADIYGDYQVEALFGEALAMKPSLRDRLQLVTKCGICLRSDRRPAHRLKHYDTGEAHVRASVEASLRALRTDRVELLLVHRPDALMDPAALAACFEALRREGKVLHFGVSNHRPSQLALLHARLPLATHQVEWSPLHDAVLDDGTLDQCLALGIAPMIWSPLAGGRLFRDDGAAAQRVREVLQRLAAHHGCSPTTLAYAWLLRHPSRPFPVAGTREIARLREAVAACAVTLDAQDWYEVLAAARGHEVP